MQQMPLSHALELVTAANFMLQRADHNKMVYLEKPTLQKERENPQIDVLFSFHIPVGLPACTRVGSKQDLALCGGDGGSEEERSEG